jgi:hypothetical protein
LATSAHLQRGAREDGGHNRQQHDADQLRQLETGSDFHAAS